MRVNTLVEKHNGVWVKREDLATDKPWPAFSKSRGVYSHIKSRPEKIIGVLDTFHSQAGWAVAAACQTLGKECINFYPLYKNDDYKRPRRPQRHSRALGAKLVPLKAGRSAILYHRARKRMEKYKGYLMPNALKLPESIVETALEVNYLKKKFDVVVIPISSGTIAAGVLKGLARNKRFPKVYIHLGYSRSHDSVIRYLMEASSSKFPFPQDKIVIVDEHYKYSDTARGDDKPDFPCNVYYDLKAWQWLMRRIEKEDKHFKGKRILFWNIGA